MPIDIISCHVIAEFRQDMRHYLFYGFFRRTGMKKRSSKFLLIKDFAFPVRLENRYLFAYFHHSVIIPYQTSNTGGSRCQNRKVNWSSMPFTGFSDTMSTVRLSQKASA